MVSVSQLQQIFPQGDASDLAEICEPLNAAMAEFNISSAQEQAMFLAQCGHESGCFSVVQENLNYRAETLVKVFPKYFRDVNPADYEKQPEKIANRVYSSRMGNGDEASGDGAARSAAWFWAHNGLNKYADADDIVGCTKRVNGGTIGLEDRTEHYNAAKAVLIG